MKPLFTSVDELNSQPELFYDPERAESENRGPFLIVRDDFYTDPNGIRRTALAHQFFQYSPPLPEQVGEEVAARNTDLRPTWLSSSLLRHWGRPVTNPQPGFRHATPEVRRAIADVIGERVISETWDEMGDWWNSAFHIHYDSGDAPRAIHHHYKEGDVAPRGWSGVIYLSPDAPHDVGTTIWQEKKTSLCIASKGAKFEQDAARFDLALSVKYRFNRLVLFRENVLHRAECGFGTTLETGRLTQTFFFHAERHQ